VLLLHGLVAGFIGPGTAKTIVGAIWMGVILRTIIVGFRSV